MKEHIKSVSELCEESPQFKACIVEVVQPVHTTDEKNKGMAHKVESESDKGAQLYQRWIGGEYLTHKLAQRF